MIGETAIFLAAGVAGGAVNVAAGGAKLFVFPLLLAAGLPPLTANATGTIALWPAQLPGAWMHRHDLAQDKRALLLRMLPALVGALCGALALIWSSEAVFLSAIPVLLLIAVVAVLLGNRTVAIMQRLFPGRRLQAAAGVLLFGSGFYGGYFGAGLGFMLLAVLTVAGETGLRRANASKNLFAFCINTTAVLPLALSGLVAWPAAGSVLIGGLFGGYLGARVVQRIPETVLRVGVSIIGLLLTASFLLR